MSAPVEAVETVVVERPQLPPYTQTLGTSQRFPRLVVAAGIAVTVASGLAGLVTGLGGGA